MSSARDGTQRIELGRRVFDAAPVLLVHLDLDGTIRDVNPYFERLTGYRGDEVRGRDWFDTFLPARDRESIRSLFRSICDQQQVRDNVNPILTRAGAELEIAWTGDILRDDAGRPLGVLAIGHDVTERVRAERAARALEQRLRNILDGMAAFVAVYDLAGNVLEANRPALTAVGLRREDAIGRPFVELPWLGHSGAEQRKFLEAHARARRGEVVRVEFNVRVGEARFADFEAVFGPLRDASGEIEAVIGSGVDVTERKAAERAARRAGGLLRAVIDGVPAIIFALDRAGTFTLSEGRGLSALGLRPGEVVGRTVQQVFGALPEIEAAWRRALAGEQVLHCQRRGPLEFETVFGPSHAADGQIDGVLGVALDVTERRAAQDALAKSEQRLAQAHRLARLGTWELDIPTQMTWWSDEQYRLSGLPPGGPISQQRFLELVHPDDRPTIDAAYGQAYTTGSTDCEFRIIRPDGAVRDIHGIARTTYDPQGRPLALIGTNQDITERKRAEAALRESEERLRLALETSGLGMWELDPQAPIARYRAEPNHRLREPGEPIDGTVGPTLDLVHPDDRDHAWSAFHAYLAGQRPKFEAEFRLRTEGGGWRWILSTGKVVERDAAGQPQRVLGTYQDIDARKLAELQMAAALREKETLLREVHHRVKNNLQIVAGLLHFQTKKTSSPDVLAACADIQRRLLAMNLVHEKLYRSSSLAFVDFGDYVRSLVGALASSFERRGAQQVDLPERRIELPSETALPAGMILCELLTNVYKYAWPGRPGNVRVDLSLEAGLVALAVEDDGVGLPPGVDPKLADSFGWQLVRTLVAQLDGRLEITSDRGTRARVLFPPPGSCSPPPEYPRP